MSLTQSLPIPSSPSIRLNASDKSSRSPDPQATRYRAPYPLPVTPQGGAFYANHSSTSTDEYGPSDVKDTQLVSPSYDHHGPSSTTSSSYHPNGPSYRASAPSSPYHHPSPLLSNGNAGGGGHGGGGGFMVNEETTLSTFLHNLFTSARNSLSNSSGSNGGSLPRGLTPSSSELSLSTFLTSFLPNTTTSSSSKDAPSSTSFKLPGASTIGFIILCGLWYLSSAFSSNTGKSILTRFRYPVTLTFVQFAFVAGYCVLILAVREQLGGAGGHGAHGHGHSLGGRRSSIGTAQGWGIKKPTRTMFQGTLMMSLFQISGHVFSSMAISRIPVSTVHTIKALSPLFTVISYAALFRVRYSSATYAALAPLTLGVMLACSFDLRANAVGFLCALGSTVIFVSQNIFSKKLLPKESTTGTTLPSQTGSSGKLDKLNLLLYSSGMAFVLMIPIWLYSDGGALLSAWMSSTPRTPSPAGTTSLTLFFFLNGTVHFAQNLLAFSILARTSPVTYSIASLIKRIAVICLAIVWSGQTVTFIQGTGMTMTFAGLWMYNRAKSDVDKGERKRGQVEKRQEMFLPTTLDDSRELDGTATPPPLSIHTNGLGGVQNIQSVRSPTYATAGFYGGAAASGGDPSGGGDALSMSRNRSTSTNNAALAQGQIPPPPMQSSYR